MGERQNIEFPFELLQDFQVKISLLTVEAEKNQVITAVDEVREDFSGLERCEVILEPCELKLDDKVLQLLNIKDKSPLKGKLPIDFLKTEEFLKSVKPFCRKEIGEAFTYQLLRTAINKQGLASYWQAMKVIAFHSFKSRMIIKKGSQLIPIKTKKQFDYYLKSQKDTDQLSDIDDVEEESITKKRDQTDSTTETGVCFDGSKEAEFTRFFSYVKQRICGKMDRQIKLGVLPPLLVWRQRFKDELIVFFKAKIGGNGYAKDYIDSRLREIQKEQNELSSMNEIQLVQKSFSQALESNNVSNRE